MDKINFNAHNIILNGQPYPRQSIRPQYPTLTGDNTVTLFFPWWKCEELWRGDVTTLYNVDTASTFASVAEFKTFCFEHFYSLEIMPPITYLGVWDASGNTPALANGDSLLPGGYYIVSTDGSVDFGDGAIDFVEEDMVIYNGSKWQNGGQTAPRSSVPINAQTGTSYTPTLTDVGSLMTFDNSSPITITLDESAGFPIGAKMDFLQLGTGMVSFTSVGSDIRSQGGNLSIADQYVCVTVLRLDLKLWVLMGSLTT